MSRRPFRLGLTGSVGMGKSAVAAMIRSAGVPVFDADAEVHRQQGPNGALLPAIEARFPGTTGDRGVDRRALGAMVFEKPDEMEALEAIVHPAVRAAREAFIARHRAHPIVLLDIPLLFETGGESEMDAIWVVSAPAFVQHRRVVARPGMDARRFARIKAAQMPDHHKRARADRVIETARPKWRTRAQVRRLLACLRRSLGR